MFVLKLPPFFPHLHGKGKRAAISKLACVAQKRIRSYIVLALVLTTLLLLKTIANWFIIRKLLVYILGSLKATIRWSSFFCPQANWSASLFKSESRNLTSFLWFWGQRYYRHNVKITKFWVFWFQCLIGQNGWLIECPYYLAQRYKHAFQSSDGRSHSLATATLILFVIKTKNKTL